MVTQAVGGLGADKLEEGSEPDARLLRRKQFRNARPAQIPFGSAQGRLSLRNRRLLGMTFKLATSGPSPVKEVGRPVKIKPA